MEKKYKVLKKFDDFKKGDVIDLAEVELTEEEVAELVEGGKIEVMEDDTNSVGSSSSGAENKGAVTKVTFHLHNRNVKTGESTRVFDALTHGEDFVKVADEFGETNKAHVISRADE